MLNKILVSLFPILCITMGFCFGTYFGQETFVPQVKYVEVETIKTVNHYKDVPVEVVKEVEVIVETPTGLREFASLEELEAWLADDQTDGVKLIFRWSDSGVVEIDLDGGPSPNVWRDPNFQDCDDYAIALQKAAAEDGYAINVQLDTKKMHALNSVFIGNEIYFVEPQTDGVWFAYYRDEEG